MVSSPSQRLFALSSYVVVGREDARYVTGLALYNRVSYRDEIQAVENVLAGVCAEIDIAGRRSANSEGKTHFSRPKSLT
ncbi:hypothetical protein GJ744_002380 [Endocarpon pusillum]|uniref:Uncharacterized protein n=1 Tax=Endocarpon pusillum TaxID=364733 RepID=A0A8H7E8K2_9EURO|nr:hypothetical protein GJ744_002380 [Endocarpon pusillum]